MRRFRLIDAIAVGLQVQSAESNEGARAEDRLRLKELSDERASRWPNTLSVSTRFIPGSSSASLVGLSLSTLACSPTGGTCTQGEGPARKAGC